MLRSSEREKHTHTYCNSKTIVTYKTTNSLVRTSKMVLTNVSFSKSTVQYSNTSTHTLSLSHNNRVTVNKTKYRTEQWPKQA